MDTINVLTMKDFMSSPWTIQITILVATGVIGFHFKYAGTKSEALSGIRSTALLFATILTGIFGLYFTYTFVSTSAQITYTNIILIACNFLYITLVTIFYFINQVRNNIYSTNKVLEKSLDTSDNTIEIIKQLAEVNKTFNDQILKNSTIFLDHLKDLHGITSSKEEDNNNTK